MLFVELCRELFRRTQSTSVCPGAAASSTSGVVTDASSVGFRNASRSAWSKKVSLDFLLQSLSEIALGILIDFSHRTVPRLLASYVVCTSVTLCIVAKRHILQQKCVKK